MGALFRALFELLQARRFDLPDLAYDEMQPGHLAAPFGHGVGGKEYLPE